MGPLYRMVTWYKNTLQEGKQCSGILKRKDILTDVIYLFFLPNSTACHPSRGIVVPSDRFFQGFIRIQKKKLTWAIFYQIFQSVIIMPSNLKKKTWMKWKRKQLQFLLKKVPTFNRPHSKISITHENKTSSQHLLIFDAKMLRAKSFNFFFAVVINLNLDLES